MGLQRGLMGSPWSYSVPLKLSWGPLMGVLVWAPMDPCEDPTDYPYKVREPRALGTHGARDAEGPGDQPRGPKRFGCFGGGQRRA